MYVCMCEVFVGKEGEKGKRGEGKERIGRDRKGKGKGGRCEKNFVQYICCLLAFSLYLRITYCFMFMFMCVCVYSSCL